MTQTQTRGSRKASNDESSDDDEPPSLGSGKPVDGQFATGGLLLRRPGFNSPQKGEDVELDNLVAREVSEWRNENSLQVLRQRKNISEHAMDEVIFFLLYYNIPYIDGFVHSRSNQFLTAHSHLLVRTLSSTLLLHQPPALLVGLRLCLIHPFLHLPVRNFVH
jgi:hypothetical protein